MHKHQNTYFWWHMLSQIQYSPPSSLAVCDREIEIDFLWMHVMSMVFCVIPPEVTSRIRQNSDEACMRGERKYDIEILSCWISLSSLCKSSFLFHPYLLSVPLLPQEQACLLTYEREEGGNSVPLPSSWWRTGEKSLKNIADLPNLP